MNLLPQLLVLAISLAFLNVWAWAIWSTAKLTEGGRDDARLLAAEKRWHAADIVLYEVAPELAVELGYEVPGHGCLVTADHIGGSCYRFTWEDGFIYRADDDDEVSYLLTLIGTDVSLSFDWEGKPVVMRTPDTDPPDHGILVSYNYSERGTEWWGEFEWQDGHVLKSTDHAVIKKLIDSVGREVAPPIAGPSHRKPSGGWPRGWIPTAGGDNSNPPQGGTGGSSPKPSEWH